ncbi:glycoside hydrolase family 68 protein [Streptococcus saliviloxodontae]|uniref:Levansucrase n=1 Tax=Streptococcus saliviloxodontae TaxID=1349416 RepID=A0ABS2PL93_9STRE|nr:glycoside hydrolase family 68 protein [Streptococcus saliviloxodontae]MBM7636199.1 levansucrase [Streptococcus saliviloxodontae]
MIKGEKTSQKLRYSIRKVSTIGATSAIIGTVAFLGATTTQADEVGVASESTTSATLVTEAEPAVTTEAPQVVETTAVSETPEVVSETTTTASEVPETVSETTAVSEATTAVDTPVTSETTNDSEATSPEVTSASQPSTTVEDKDYSSYSATTIVKETGLTELADALVREAGIDPTTLSAERKEELNKLYVKSTETGTQMTYGDFQSIADTLLEQNEQYAIPYFKASEIKNMAAATTRDAQTGEVADLDVWDSWPVQDIKTGEVVNWNGYQLVVAMMGVPNTNDNHLYLLYNTYADNDLQHWQNAGSIFGYGLDAVTQQWSGSAVVNQDGTIQLYYTNVDTSDNNSNNQMLATATLNLAVENNKVVIKSVDNKNILTPTGGDGYYYQSYAQWRSTFTGADNIAMRDPHVIEDEDGSRYLVFEASTGTQNYQDASQIYNVKNYGRDAKFILSSFFDILDNEDMYIRASVSNAAIGILRLGGTEKAPTIQEFFTPLLSSPMVSDEIERPNVVKLGNKYYLFAASRLNHGSNDYAWQEANKVVGDNVVMLGYVSDSLTGTYEPLNGSGAVLTASVPSDWRTATYSYYAVPVKGSDDLLLITAYMTNRNEVAGKGNNSTWAPSFLIQIMPDGTTKVLAKMTNQGDWIWDESSETQATIGNKETSHLPGEDDGIIEGNPGGYDLKPHTPKAPDKPTEPDTPVVPEQPSTPVTPDTPNTPSVPETPTYSHIEKLHGVPTQTASILPQTGEKDSKINFLGMAMLTSLVVFFTPYKRKRKH